MIEELIIRSLCDSLPAAPADAHFLYGQTPDNEASVFAAAHLLFTTGRSSEILFMNTGPMSGYSGFSSWQEALSRQGIEKEAMVPVPPVPADTAMLHTLIEAQSVVAFARERRYKSLVVTAAPFQQPRALMTAVTAALKDYPELLIYSFPGRALPWQEEVVHSQGKVEGARAALIAGEMERIRKYHAQGDLDSVEEVLHYLNRRDKGLL